MTRTTRQDTPRIAAQDRAEAQRQRILKAARQRFIEQGFHAASMESIAQLAGVSTGLSYRYFRNKRALILAIIEQNLAEERRGLQSLPLQTSAADFANNLSQLFQLRGAEAWNAVLFSEITAAGARDPEIGGVLEQAEALAAADFTSWLKQRDKKMAIRSSAEDLKTRALMMRCLFAGLIVRSSREPDLDVVRLEAMLRRLLPLIMPDDQR